MSLFRTTDPDGWYDDVAEYRSSDDPEDRRIGDRMDRCRNNPRNGGPGYFGRNQRLDRRSDRGTR